MNECSTEDSSNRTCTEQRALDTATAAELVALRPGSTSREVVALDDYRPLQVARRLAQTARVSNHILRTGQANGRLCPTLIPITSIQEHHGG